MNKTSPMHMEEAKSFKDCCRLVAIKHRLGTTLVTGHRAAYWTEAAEMWVKVECDQIRAKLDEAEKDLSAYKERLEIVSQAREEEREVAEKMVEELKKMLAWYQRIPE